MAIIRRTAERFKLPFGQIAPLTGPRAPSKHKQAYVSFALLYFSSLSFPVFLPVFFIAGSLFASCLDPRPPGFYSALSCAQGSTKTWRAWDPRVCPGRPPPLPAQKPRPWCRHSRHRERICHYICPAFGRGQGRGIDGFRIPQNQLVLIVIGDWKAF